VVFAGTARLAVPLTRDLRSFADLVEQAGPLSVPRGGTDLGAALESALEALEGRTGRHETVLLLTDGDDLEGRGRVAAARCRERGIRVHCVGFGSARGAKIPVEGEGGGSFLRDRAGREVVVKLDAESLRAIAEAAGGDYVEADDESRALPGLYEKRVLPMARRSFEAEERRERENRFQWPLLVAFLLWTFDLGFGVRRR
jgi:Ca-activated chloride channel family protein